MAGVPLVGEIQRAVLVHEQHIARVGGPEALFGLEDVLGLGGRDVLDRGAGRRCGPAQSELGEAENRKNCDREQGCAHGVPWSYAINGKRIGQPLMRH
jgi:hypothetical protein